MLGLLENIKTIEALVEQNTPASLTYASLECRLTIENICYERLRVAHDYISHDDISKWQPKDVVKTLIQEVDPAITADVKLSVSKNSSEEDEGKSSEEIEYLEIGEQIGFNANRLGKLWNALANLALHIPVPKHKDDKISKYGDVEKIHTKIQECLVEFYKISKTTLVLSGLGEEVSFKCLDCETLNKRKLDTLEEGKVISCINANCVEKYTAEKISDGFRFERRRTQFECTCKNILSVSENAVTSLKPGHNGIRIECSSCKKTFLVDWKLYYRREFPD